MIQYLGIKIDQSDRPIDSYFQHVSLTGFYRRALITRDFVSWIKRKYRSLLLAHCTGESELNYQPVSMLEKFELARISGPEIRVVRSICVPFFYGARIEDIRTKNKKDLNKEKKVESLEGRLM